MPPRPTPTATLAQRGSWRANLRDGEPMPATPQGCEAPQDLDGPALVIWEALAPRLHNAGLLTEADLNTFARYCRVYAAWSAAMASLEGAQDRQAVLTLAKLDELLRRLESNFGLSPADRTGIRVEAPQAEGKARFFKAG